MPDAASTHPSPRELAEYALGKLDAGRMATVSAHLTDCPACRETIDAQPADSFVGRLKAAAQGGTLPAGPVSPGATTPLPPGLQAAEEGVPAELTASGKYEVLGKLGQGGMGAVWKARHTFLQQPVAIKVMHAQIGANADARARFLREMQATAKLRHPHIVRALDAEALGDHLILVVEYVEGITLDRLVKQKGPVPAAYACRWVVQAAEGLQHAHEQGTVHRDIKPGNLMITRDTKEVKVLDFGLARGPREEGGAGQTRLQTFMGTPEYVAPEQATNARDADIRADVYSLGCTLYFLLTGRPPFERANALETIVAHLQDPATPVEEVRKDLPAGLGAVVAKMMAKGLDERYQTAGEAAEALRPFTGGKAAEVKRPARQSSQPQQTAEEEAPLDVVRPVIVSPRRTPKARPKKASPRWPLYTGVILAGLAATALLALGVITLTTDDGKAEVEFRFNEPGWRATIDGALVTVSPADGKGPIRLRVVPGTPYKLKVEKDGFEAETDGFVYRKGDKKVVEVTIRAKQAPAARREPAKEPEAAEGKPAQDAPVAGSLFFNGKDLTGWEGMTGYWHVEGGAIVGRCPPGRPAHTFLVSKRTFKDFDLKFQVRRKGGVGNSGVQFRSQVSDWSTFRVVGPQCEIDSAGFDYPPGSLLTEPNLNPLAVKAPQLEVAPAYTDAGFNDYHIRCVGKHVTIKVNGITAIDGAFPSLPDEGVIAWQIHGRMTCPEITFRNVVFQEVPQQREGFVPLFNGKDLTGWKVHPAGTGNWKVEDGAVCGSGPASHLFSERGDYRDFHLRAECKINHTGNSGVYFRAQFGPGFPRGYEAQINATHRDLAKTGSLYPDGREKDMHIETNLIRVAPHKPDEWFTLEVICVGAKVTILVNGKKTAEWTDPKHRFREGHFALQQHHPGSVVQFRRIEVKELAARP